MPCSLSIKLREIRIVFKLGIQAFGLYVILKYKPCGLTKATVDQASTMHYA